jgi:hypothetical protein
MMTLTIPPVAADELARGDRISAKFLPLRGPADVRYVEPFTSDTDWVLVAYRYDDGVIEASHFLADTLIPVERRADDTGLHYSREADDPTPVSPARAPSHVGSVIEGNELIVDGRIS